MTDEEEIRLAKSLPAGSRKAILLMTETYQLPGRDTFNANAAFNLSWRAQKFGGLAVYKIVNRRAAYRLTPLGQRIKERVQSNVTPIRRERAA